ncbi:hypothetical protein BJY01DRAFT_250556 [Aspergillus pseudoustus]|uniref:Uncharacterized protein n=1 Tax=Aspergillus pseudoustus TaxID=1810923 RepID=A0ABR4JH63_9EURO
MTNVGTFEKHVGLIVVIGILAALLEVKWLCDDPGGVSGLSIAVIFCTRLQRRRDVCENLRALNPELSAKHLVMWWLPDKKVRIKKSCGYHSEDERDENAVFFEMVKKLEDEN